MNSISIVDAQNCQIFLRVLKKLPTDAVGYKPHERCPTAQQLVWILTSELKACIDVATQNRAEWQSLPAPPLPEMVRLFEQRSNELIDSVSKMDEGSWNRTAQFYYEGKVVSEQPVNQFLWFILFDAIHHRGQINSYIVSYPEVGQKRGSRRSHWVSSPP